MPILSLEFSFFFLCFFPLYWLCQANVRWQNALILGASLFWLCYLRVSFAIVVMLYATFTYMINLAIQRLPAKKLWFIIGIVGTLCLLGFFKYNQFFLPTLRQVLGDQLDILMPLGISYYCFQGIAYMHAVYKGQKPMPWLESCCFLSFFTTITTGPIVRSEDLAYHPEVVEPIRTPTLKKVKNKLAFPGAYTQFMHTRRIVQPHLALAYLLLGTFKVWVVSSFLGTHFVTPVFDNPDQYGTLDVLLGIYGYAWQLYCNFSGSIDLVIGLGMLLGFNLPPNFAQPLRAVNIRDFWDRWHITLSLWIRDYIYIPLGGSRHGGVRTALNLMIAMILSGIWHGYGWTFALWGGLHGLALIGLNFSEWKRGQSILRQQKSSSRKKASRKKTLSPMELGRQNALHKTPWGKVIAIFCTFNFICLTFVIFNSQSLSDAGLVFSSLSNWSIPSQFHSLYYLIAMVAFLFIYPVIHKAFQYLVYILEGIPYIALPIPLAILLSIIIALAPAGIPSFIYANF